MVTLTIGTIPLIHFERRRELQNRRKDKEKIMACRTKKNEQLQNEKLAFNVLIEKGLTHVIQNICSFLDFEDRLVFIYSHPGLLRMAKLHKSVLFSPYIPNDKDQKTIFKYIDELINQPHSIKFNKENFALYVMETKSLETFNFFQEFLGDEIVAFGCISDDQLPIIGDFLEKVIEENDVEAYFFINHHLQKTRNSKTSMLEIDHKAYTKAQYLARLEMMRYYLLCMLCLDTNCHWL